MVKTMVKRLHQDIWTKPTAWPVPGSFGPIRVRKRTLSSHWDHAKKLLVANLVPSSKARSYVRSVLAPSSDARSPW